MAMSPLHRNARRQLWRLAAVLAVLLFAGRVLGAHTALHVLEWLPMTAALLLLAAHGVGFARRVHQARARRGRS
jgi:uncharacterized membrane protein YfcA